MTTIEEMAAGLERIAGGALSDYEGSAADERHLVQCAQLLREQQAEIATLRRMVDNLAEMASSNISARTVTSLDDEQCTRIYDAVTRRNITRDVKTAADKCATVRQAQLGCEAVGPTIAAREPVGQEPAMYQVRPRSFEDGEGWREVAKREFDDQGDFPGYNDDEWERRMLYAAPPTQPHEPKVDLDSTRLEFVLKHMAWVREKKADSGSMTYWLETQDEDENFISLSGDGRFFRSPREAIDAAIALIDSQGKP